MNIPRFFDRVRSWIRDPLKKDTLLIIVFTVSVAVVTHRLSTAVLLPVWQDGGVLRWIYSTGVSIMGSNLLFNAVIVGAVVGLTIAWLFDTYKQTQIVIPIVTFVTIALGSGFSLVTFLSNATPVTFVISGLSTLLIFQICGVSVLNLYFKGSVLEETPRDLQRVPKLLVIGVAGLMLVGTLDYHLLQNLGAETTGGAIHRGFVRDLVLAGFLIILLGSTTVYSNQMRVILIGPGKVGKTALIGGLYSDIKSNKFGNNRGSRELTSGQLESISNDIKNKQTFPEWTSDDHWLHFSYYNRTRIFRRRNTFVALDYEGEKLVGKGGNQRIDDNSGFADKLNDYSQRRGQLSFLSRLRKNLRQLSERGGPEDWLLDPNDPDDEVDIGRLLYTADIVMFTLPMEDFLEVPMKYGDAPPDYAMNIAAVEQTSDGYQLTYPNGDVKFIRETTEQEAGEYIEEETGNQFDASFDFEALPKIDSNRRIWNKEKRSKIENEAETEPSQDTEKRELVREEYLEEYQSIIENFPDVVDKDVIWTVTKTDLHDWTDDDGDPMSLFSEAYEQVKTDLRDPEVGDDESNQGINEDDPSSSHKNNDDLNSFLKDRGWFEGPRPKSDRDDYKLLSKWIEYVYMEDAVTGPDGLMDDSSADYLYPVWYDVAGRDDMGKLQIETGNGRILNGSKHLIDRLEGQTLSDGLVVDHPEYTPLETVFNQWTPFDRPTVDAPVDKALEKMHKAFYAEHKREDE